MFSSRVCSDKSSSCKAKKKKKKKKEGGKEGEKEKEKEKGTYYRASATLETLFQRFTTLSNYLPNKLGIRFD